MDKLIKTDTNLLERWRFLHNPRLESLQNMSQTGGLSLFLFLFLICWSRLFCCTKKRFYLLFRDVELFFFCFIQLRVSLFPLSPCYFKLNFASNLHPKFSVLLFSNTGKVILFSNFLTLFFALRQSKKGMCSSHTQASEISETVYRLAESASVPCRICQKYAESAAVWQILQQIGRIWQGLTGRVP